MHVFGRFSCRRLPSGSLGDTFLAFFVPPTALWVTWRHVFGVFRAADCPLGHLATRFWPFFVPPTALWVTWRHVFGVFVLRLAAGQGTLRKDGGANPRRFAPRPSHSPCPLGTSCGPLPLMKPRAATGLRSPSFLRYQASHLIVKNSPKCLSSGFPEPLDSQKRSNSYL